MRSRHLRPQAIAGSAFARFFYPPDVIVLAVRWYLRFSLSYRDLEELLAERGIELDHTTIYRWVQRFTPPLAAAARPYRHAVGSRWQVDETYLKVARPWRYVYRAVDEFGQVIDVLVAPRRDATRPDGASTLPSPRPGPGRSRSSPTGPRPTVLTGDEPAPAGANRDAAGVYPQLFEAPDRSI